MTNEKNILLLCSHAERLAYYKYLIEGYFSCSVNACKDFASSPLSFGAHLSQSSLLLVAGSVPSLDAVLNDVREFNKNFPIIVVDSEDAVSSDFLVDPLVRVIPEKSSHQNVLTAIQHLLEKDSPKSFLSEFNVPDFCQVDINLVPILNIAKELYIKLSENKYLKLYFENGYCVGDDIQRYKDKGVTHVYLKSADFEDLLSTVAKSLEMNSESVDLYPAAYQDLIHEKISKIGLSSATITITNVIIDSSLKLIEKHMDLKRLWQRTVRQRSYISEHSLMLSYLSCAILDQTRWVGQANQIKLCLGALFHDMALSSPQLAQIQSMNDESFEKLSREDKNAVLTHPVRIFELLGEVEGMPADVDKILVQHHEKYDGTGFPRRLDYAHISPLAALMIVAHEILDQLYFKEFSSQEIEKIIERMEPLYTKGPFLEIVQAAKRALS